MTSSNGDIFRVTGLHAGNSPVPGKFPAHRPVTQSFDVFFDLRLNKRLTKQSWGWWFETLSRPLWRHCNGYWSEHFTTAVVVLRADDHTWYDSEHPFMNWFLFHSNNDPRLDTNGRWGTALWHATSHKMLIEYELMIDYALFIAEYLNNTNVIQGFL